MRWKKEHRETAGVDAPPMGGDRRSGRVEEATRTLSSPG